MKYLIIGSGGREHAIAWRLMHDGSATEVFVAPGNGGIQRDYRVDIAVNDFSSITAFCKDRMIDMVIVGPEVPLTEGIVDYLEENQVPVFGPSRRAAMLEGSKLFAKEIMEKYGVPTGAHYDFTDREKLIAHVNRIEKYPIVIKLDGLAAGKGVGIPESREEALAFIDENVKDTTRVFVEEYLEGEEASVLGISDGENILCFPAAQDHKRIFNGDRGPNTGGMGAYAPAPVMTDDRLKIVHDKVLQPTIDGMKKEGIPFKGILYAGLMVNGDDIRVLEFNVRFGDPEVQVILPLLEGKLGDIIQGSVNGALGGMSIAFKKSHAITVVMSSKGYPGSYEKGKLISGLDSLPPELIVFHAGTREDNGRFYTNGGRVLNVTSMADSLQRAYDNVYESIKSISFEGAYYRDDIAYRALS